MTRTQCRRIGCWLASTALCWASPQPIISARDVNDDRVSTLEGLFAHCAAQGYDGIEIGPSMTEFVPWFDAQASHAERVALVRELVRKTGVEVVGATYCVGGRAGIEDPAKGYHNLVNDGFAAAAR